MNWPLYFSDLNLIEHTWAKLKEWIYKIEPGIECLTGADEKVRTVFTRAIEHAWKDLDQDYFDRLIKSMAWLAKMLQQRALEEQRTYKVQAGWKQDPIVAAAPKKIASRCSFIAYFLVWLSRYLR